MAVGSLAAAFSIAYSGKARQRTLFIGAAGFSVLLFCLALSGVWPVTVAILVALGWFSITMTATANSRLQIVTPPQLRGRIMSLYTMLFMGTTPIGSIVLGTLADRQGVRVATAEVALMCGAGTVAALIYLYRHRAPASATAERRPLTDASSL
jgi:predicted MFS family arabinose efflux permease